MTSLKETISSILHGASVDATISAMLHEKRICVNRGPRKRRTTKRGRVYYVQDRVCRGRPDPTRSRRVKRSLIGRAKVRSRAQLRRWRNLGSKVKKLVRRRRSRKR